MQYVERSASVLTAQAGAVSNVCAHVGMLLHQQKTLGHKIVSPQLGYVMQEPRAAVPLSVSVHGPHMLYLPSAQPLMQRYALA